MHRFLAPLLLLLIGAPVVAQDRSSPAAFVVSLLEHFNAGDIEDYVERFAYPHGRVLGNDFAIVDNREIPLRTYQVMRESGWAYSRLNAIEILEENDHSALVRVRFSRFDSEDSLIQSFTAYYTLVLDDGSWKIVNLMAVAQGLPGMQMDRLR